MSESATKLKVEGAEVTPTSPTEEKLPTYKAIPESDTEYKSVPNSNMVKENGDNCKDGADEKMLTPKGELADVKFITGDQQNGDAKIDILEIKQAFTGLTKEELLKFSNDPFWVRLRWIMFVGFWLLWLGMLAGAIIIIVGAPKCAPPPPKTWWQDGPLVEVKASKDSSETTPWNLASLLEKLPTLSELKIKGLIVPEALLPGTDSYSALNLNESQLQEFKNLAEQAKEKNIKLIVDLTANGVSKTSDWFVKSERGDVQYKDYFLWRPSKSIGGEEQQPPNDWVSINNQPAWTYSETRKEFYLHQIDENKPDLNFRNPEVAKEFEKVLQFWIKNGVTGARLFNAKYLLVDPSFNDEALSKKPGADLKNYDFYAHSKTSNQEGLADLLLTWKNVILKDTDNQGTFILDGYLESTEALKKNGTIVVDLPCSSKLMDESHSMGVQKTYTAKQFDESLRSSFVRLGDAWPSWKFSSNNDAMSSEFEIMSTLLPGVPIFTVSQVLEFTSNTSSSDASLLAMRELPSFKHGGYYSTLLANNTIFAFTRLKSGNPGIMVLFNPSDNVVNTNTTLIDAIPEKMTVSLLSQNYKEEGVNVRSKLDSVSVPVSPKSVIVLTYVPLKE